MAKHRAKSHDRHSGPARSAGEAGEPELPGWLKAAGPYLLLVAIVALAYAPILGNGFVNYDDPMYVTANAHVLGGLSSDGLVWAFTTTEGANWHPLTFLSHMLDCQLFKLAPWGHHLTSLLLHLLNTILVFLVFRAMTRAKWPSFFLAALFGVHPLHVESVAWVAERKDVLSGCFWLLTMAAYAGYVRALGIVRQPGAGRPGGRPGDYYAVALGCFILGLMSKPMVVTLPFALLLLDYWPLGRVKGGGDLAEARIWRRLAIEKVPFFALAAAGSVITLAIQRQAGAMERLQSVGFGDRVGNALISYCRYLDKLFWPGGLAIYYPHPGHWPVAGVAVAAALLIALTAGAVALRVRYPFLAVGWFWFLGTLVPVIGLVQVGGQSMADRYMYLPMIGALVVVVWGARALTAGWRLQKRALPAAGTIAVAICAGLTMRQAACWHDSGTLFQQAIDSTDRNYIAYFHLAEYLLSQGEMDAAAAMYRKSIEAFDGMKEAHNNLGAVLLMEGHTDAAMEQFKDAIRLKPSFPDPHNGLGLALRSKGMLDDALAEFQKAAELDPGFFQAHLDLADALAAKSRFDDAVPEYQAALKLRPNSADTHAHLGAALAKMDRRTEAVVELKRALELKPGDSEATQQLRALEK
jgi:tetratricopeptide (TPR) repeat protein